MVGYCDRDHDVVLVTDRIVQIQSKGYIIHHIVCVPVFICTLTFTFWWIDNAFSERFNSDTSWSNGTLSSNRSCSYSTGGFIIVTATAILKTVVVAVGGSACRLTLIATALLSAAVVGGFATVCASTTV